MGGYHCVDWVAVVVQRHVPYAAVHACSNNVVYFGRGHVVLLPARFYEFSVCERVTLTAVGVGKYRHAVALSSRGLRCLSTRYHALRSHVKSLLTYSYPQPVHNCLHRAVRLARVCAAMLDVCVLVR